MPRTPWLWPFRHDSPWNLPAAASAEFEHATDARTAALINPSISTWVNRDSYSLPVTLAAKTDPLAAVTDTNLASRSASFRVPVDAPIATGSDAHMMVVTPDQHYTHECWFTKRVSSTSYTVGRHERSDLYGYGFGPLGGARAYGGSAIGGLIRAWEVQAGEIRHALAVALANPQLYKTTGTSGADSYGYARTLGYTWPATEQDADSLSTYTGTIPMGTYVAIPGWVDVEALPVSDAGKAVARAFQRFGAYIVDRSSGFTLYAEPSADATWTNSVRADLPAIRQCLRVVVNNTPDTPNGGPYLPDGSNRLAPLAEPLLPCPKVTVQ